MIYKQYATLTAPEGNRDFESKTCNHCGAAIIAEDHQRFRSRQGIGHLGGYCKGGCGQWICDKCVGGECDTIEMKLKRMEGR
jgi:hypothetical protein